MSEEIEISEAEARKLDEELRFTVLCEHFAAEIDAPATHGGYGRADRMRAIRTAIENNPDANRKALIAHLEEVFLASHCPPNGVTLSEVPAIAGRRRWFAVLHESRAPRLDTVYTRDWGNARWPSDELVGDMLGVKVKSRGHVTDDIRETIYEEVR